MNSKEREQLIVFEQLKKKVISQREAAIRLKITVQWIRKKHKRYVLHGAEGLCHVSRGRESKNRWQGKEKEQLIELLKNEWEGFGASFAAEKLKALHGIDVSKETVRKTMIQSGFHVSKRRKQKHRAWRERREMRGMMVQLDGSPHDWFEGRAERCTLLVFIDDATSEILLLEFVKSESNIDVISATKKYMEMHGIPESFYVDFGAVFSVNLNNPERDKKTQWERILSELAVNIIHARSPQAKGRVERANKTMQDRLVKELRLAKISSMEEANTWLKTSDFIQKHNQRFAVPAAKSGDAHRSTELYNLSHIFCLKDERVLANDFTISFYSKFYQLEKEQPTILRPKDIITVKMRLDGSISLYIRQTKLAFHVITLRPPQPAKEKQVAQYTARKPSKNSRLWSSGSYLPPSQLLTTKSGE
jgi:hypothetical protein